MKKMATLTFVLTLGLMSCQNENKQINTNEVIKVEVKDDTEKIAKVFGEFKDLYNELLEIKEKADFKKFGFGAGGSYNNWLQKVQELKNNPDSDLLLKKGVLIVELEQLGLAYASSKGEETDVTESFNKIFSNAISRKTTVKVESESGNSDYEKIKAEYEIFGKWRIKNSAANLNYPYEIYNKGTEYIGVIPEGKYKTENLEKKGNKYFVKDNKSGEYYLIDVKMNMSLFDKDGELESMGYKAVRE